jgi:hypothetical protein
MLVTGPYNEAVFLWDVRSAHVMRTLPAHSDPVSGVDFLHDSSMVCSCAVTGAPLIKLNLSAGSRPFITFANSQPVSVCPPTTFTYNTASFATKLQAQLEPLL